MAAKTRKRKTAFLIFLNTSNFNARILRISFLSYKIAVITSRVACTDFVVVHVDRH